MKALIAAILLSILLTITALAQPDTLWTRTYGGSNDDLGNYVQQTSDGGYIIAGYTYSYGEGSSDVYLIKTDSSGNEIWYNTFGGTYSDVGYSVMQTEDGGYIIAGDTYSFGAGWNDVYLIKTDGNGNQSWSQTFGGSSNDCGYCVQQTSDGGYIIAGWTLSYGAGSYDVYLIKTDASGNQQWQQTFGGGPDDIGNSVQQTSDGGYIIAGYTGSYGAGYWDVYLIKTDASGNQQWSQTFGGSYYDRGNSVQQTSDGGYIIAGWTEAYGAYNTDVYLIKTDASGNQQWQQTFGGSFDDLGFSVQQTSDGGYIIAGKTESYGAAGGDDVYLIKTDAYGNQLWSQTFGGSSNDDCGYSVQQTTDGGYIIAGYTESFGAGGCDVYLVRLDSETTPNVIITLIPYNPPIQIPVSGGTFDFNIAVENTGTSIITADIWTMATLPNGNEYGPIIGPVNLIMNPGYSGNRDRTQNVPASAPAGLYTYDAYIGDYPDEILDEDHFDFEKLSTDNGSNYVHDWNCWGEGFAGETVEAYIPSGTVLHPPFPNPFNTSTVISFEMRDAGEVSLIVYDIQGREIQSLVTGHRSLGYHEVVFDGSELSSGMYFIRLTVDSGQSIVRKVVLMKQ